MARIVQALEPENHQFNEANKEPEAQLTDRTAVPDLTRRRRR
ncbi:MULTISPECIES: hypothetical protein [unclassified Streptomyces]